jgi:hypothetical protein
MMTQYLKKSIIMQITEGYYPSVCTRVSHLGATQKRPLGYGSSNALICLAKKSTMAQGRESIQ